MQRDPVGPSLNPSTHGPILFDPLLTVIYEANPEALSAQPAAPVRGIHDGDCVGVIEVHSAERVKCRSSLVLRGNLFGRRWPEPRGTKLSLLFLSKKPQGTIDCPCASVECPALVAMSVEIRQNFPSDEQVLIRKVNRKMRIHAYMCAMPSVAVVLFRVTDRKSTRLNSSHLGISYAVFC